MRSSALAISWMTTVWACTQGPAPPDAEEPRVYVENHIVSTWPAYRRLAEVTFQDPSGAMLEAHPLTEPIPLSAVYALMPDGGRVSVLSDTSLSPSYISLSRWFVEGVKPGDHLVFGGDNQPPSGCESRIIRDWTVDPVTHVATWADPDAASVDARIIRHSSAVCGMPPFPGYRCTVEADLDGSTSTSVTIGDVLRSVSVIACPNASYDEIRTAVASRFGPYDY